MNPCSFLGKSVERVGLSFFQDACQFSNVVYIPLFSLGRMGSSIITWLSLADLSYSFQDPETRKQLWISMLQLQSSSAKVSLAPPTPPKRLNENRYYKFNEVIVTEYCLLESNIFHQQRNNTGYNLFCLGEVEKKEWSPNCSLKLVRKSVYNHCILSWIKCHFTTSYFCLVGPAKKSWLA